MTVRIGGRSIGRGNPTFIVAEAGVNHLGDIDRAIELIDRAAEAGADAIKFQTYKAEKLTTPDAPRFWDWEGEIKSGGSQYDSYSLLDKLPDDAYECMFKRCEEKGIEFLSTPFDIESVAMLDELGSRLFKIASCDITNLPLLRAVARTKKPILLSTGASTMEEILAAVRIIEEEGNHNSVPLHCILKYPTEYADINLDMIGHIQSNFPGYPVGLSDHTLGIIVPALAVMVGACVVEKHYTLDKSLPTSADHWLSVDPADLKEMVRLIRIAEVSRGLDHKQRIPAEERAFLYARRSIVAARDIKQGERLTEENITPKRPGTGISPMFFDLFLRRTSRRDIQKDALLCWDDI
jgi:sialic acid synthase SpsE